MLRLNYFDLVMVMQPKVIVEMPHYKTFQILAREQHLKGLMAEDSNKTETGKKLIRTCTRNLLSRKCNITCSQTKLL